MGFRWIVLPVAALAAGACVQVLGDGFRVEGGGGGSGATSSGGGGSGATSSGGGGSGAEGGAPPCIDGFATGNESCVYAPASEVLVYTNGDPMNEALSIELYYAFGAPPPDPFGTPFGFDFYGENYATCGVCARICDQGCARQLLAVSGHLEVISQGPIGAPFAGTLTDAVFAEVTIDPNTFESTLVPFGASHCVGSFSFSSNITQQ